MAEKVTTSCLIITFLVYIAPIKYTFIVKKKKKKQNFKKCIKPNIYIFYVICNGTQPVAMRALSVLQAVIQLTTFLLHNEQLSMSE